MYMILADANLDAPAFGAGSEAADGSNADVITTLGNDEGLPETSVVEPVVAATEEEVEPERVKYSRFKKFHDRALEADEFQKQADYWRGVAEANMPKPVQQVADTEMPSYWVANYGDSDASKEAWRNQVKLMDDMKAQARQEALDAVRNERTQEAERTKENLSQLDENFEDLEAQVGRDLTASEQEAVLDIIDDYTPKDANGNYLGAIIPFNKAWEIYELKQQVTKAPKAKARDQVARLSGAGSNGATTVTQNDDNFNPMDWNAYQRRI